MSNDALHRPEDDDPSIGDSLQRILPSPGGFALWLYALAFVFIPAMLAWKGLAYIIGVVIVAIGLRPHIEGLAADPEFCFGFRWFGRHYKRTFRVGLKDQAVWTKLTNWALMLLTLLVLPLLAYVLQYQGRVFYAQLNAQLPEISAGMRAAIDSAHDQLPAIIPDVDKVEGEGWKGLSNLFSQVAGDAVNDIKIGLKEFSKNILKIVGTLIGDWVKLVIGAIIVGSILASWKKEVEMHRAIISRGIKSAPLRKNVLRYGELYQEGISLFMIGYLEVSATLSFLYLIAMLVLPLGLSLSAILFMAVILGFATAVPKIGSFIAMAISLMLMASNFQSGLGWFGYEAISFGLYTDVAIRIGLLMGTAKVLGLFEAYNFTPEIIGARLGMTKMQIIATVVIWAIGAGFFGMIWGIVISLAFQAALRLSLEAEDQETAQKEP